MTAGGRVCHDPCQSPRIQESLFLVEFPVAILLGEQASLQLVCKTADGSLERLQLLVEIAAKSFKFRRFGEIVSLDFLIEFRREDRVFGIRFGQPVLEQFQWIFGIRVVEFFRRRGIFGIALCQLPIIQVGIVKHAFVKLLVLVAVRTLAGFAVRLFLVRILVRIITGVCLIVRIVSELVGIAEVADELTGEPGKLHLVRKHPVQLFQGFTRLFEKAILELLADLPRDRWKLATGGKSADCVADGITE